LVFFARIQENTIKWNLSSIRSTIHSFSTLNTLLYQSDNQRTSITKQCHSINKPIAKHLHTLMTFLVRLAGKAGTHALQSSLLDLQRTGAFLPGTNRQTHIHTHTGTHTRLHNTHFSHTAPHSCTVPRNQCHVAHRHSQKEQSTDAHFRQLHKRPTHSQHRDTKYLQTSTDQARTQLPRTHASTAANSQPQKKEPSTALPNNTC
jgi:hypothetical protein